MSTAEAEREDQDREQRARERLSALAAEVSPHQPTVATELRNAASDLPFWAPEIRADRADLLGSRLLDIGAGVATIAEAKDAVLSSLRKAPT